MSNVPTTLKYSDNTWVRDDGGGTYTVGITDYAQAQTGSVLTVVDLPTAGTAVNTGDNCGIIETVTAAVEVRAPISGTITAVNDDMVIADPEFINTDPYGKGWLLQLTAPDASGYNALMDAAAYQAATDE